MGFWISYVATKAPEQDLLDTLGLVRTEISEDMPDRQWWTARLVETDWCILWSEDVNFAQENEESIAKLSKTAPTLSCIVGEGSNWVKASRFSDGRRDWSLAWVGDKGPQELSNLDVQGQLPAQADRELKKVIENQKNTNGVDLIFEFPIDLASKECGFRYDMYLKPNAVDRFQLVEKRAAVSASKGGVFSRLFGRRNG